MLVWGRYAEDEAKLERITLPFSEASEDRDITIGGRLRIFLVSSKQRKRKGSVRSLGALVFLLIVLRLIIIHRVMLLCCCGNWRRFNSRFSAEPILYRVEYASS